jgi:hypothetical protein
MPGVRVNLSSRGISTTLGVRGASINIGSNGVHSNFGIPGTGISSRTRILGNTRQRSNSVNVLGSNNGQASYNPDLEEILEIHIHTPAPGDLIDLEREELHLPTAPSNKMSLSSFKTWELVAILFPVILFIVSLKGDTKLSSIGTLIFSIFILSLVYYRHQKIAKKQQIEFETKYNAIREQLDRLEEEQSQLNKMLQNPKQYVDDILKCVLDTIAWPRETLISYNVENNSVFFDIDLPEVEDMPETILKTTPSGQSVMEDAMSNTQIRKVYARHVHGIGFRVIGEALRALNFIDTVILSGYTQRPDPATGVEKDDYIYSVRVDRATWEKINFDALRNVDPIEALGTFEIRRNMTKTGIFKAIEPFS